MYIYYSFSPTLPVVLPCSENTVRSSSSEQAPGMSILFPRISIGALATWSSDKRPCTQKDTSDMVGTWIHVHVNCTVHIVHPALSFSNHHGHAVVCDYAMMYIYTVQICIHMYIHVHVYCTSAFTCTRTCVHVQYMYMYAHTVKYHYSTWINDTDMGTASASRVTLNAMCTLPLHVHVHKDTCTLCMYTYLQFSLGLFKAFSVTCINNEHDSIYCWEIIFPHSSCSLVPTKVKGCKCYSSYRHLFFSYNYKLYMFIQAMYMYMYIHIVHAHVQIEMAMPTQERCTLYMHMW